VKRGGNVKQGVWRRDRTGEQDVDKSSKGGELGTTGSAGIKKHKDSFTKRREFKRQMRRRPQTAVITRKYGVN